MIFVTWSCCRKVTPFSCRTFCEQNRAKLLPHKRDLHQEQCRFENMVVSAATGLARNNGCSRSEKFSIY